MKDIKLSFPYPSTSRHNLSQDIAISLSMGLVTPVRVVEVLPGDSHRLATSFSLLSNPLMKPLLQGVRMRYCRFWVPRRIYHPAQRENDSNYDPRVAPVRFGGFSPIYMPIKSDVVGNNYVARQQSNFNPSSLFDYLDIAPVESNFTFLSPISQVTATDRPVWNNNMYFNAETYLGYMDICRNYYADSANGMIAFYSHIKRDPGENNDDWFSRGVVVTPLASLDKYIESVQHSEGVVMPFDYTQPIAESDAGGKFTDPFFLRAFNSEPSMIPYFPTSYPGRFAPAQFGFSHVNLCVPVCRPDRLSRLYDTTPLVSQNATISPSEISIGNLSFLSKLQRFLTRRLFGGSRYTDVMYSVFGQKVPHVDSPKLLDVFDVEIGSELVAGTAASDNQSGQSSNVGTLGGYFSASGVLTTGGSRSRKRYTFNEAGYIMDLVHILPRVFRSAFVPDYLPVTAPLTTSVAGLYSMAQGNFIPDFNGIGWQQPPQNSFRFDVTLPTGTDVLVPVRSSGFSCEPCYQQYRTLPDICKGFFNPNRSIPHYEVSNGIQNLNALLQPTLNTPMFIFSDRSVGYNVVTGLYFRDQPFSAEQRADLALANMMFISPDNYSQIFGFDSLMSDNIFCVFRYSHQAKRQVTKRFTLNFA